MNTFRVKTYLEGPVPLILAMFCR